MKQVTKFNFRTLLVLFLSLALCLSTALSVACNNDNSSSSSSSSSTEEKVYPTDTQTVLNGDFEFSTFTKDNDDFPVASSISWVRSSDSITTSAISSSYASGIINTDATAYAEIASAAGFHKIAGSDEYFNPKTPYEYGLIAEEDSYVYSEDLENEDAKPMTGTKVLMIHNEVKGTDGKGNGEGTAQKFTSSASLSLAKHEFAKISVWVLTHDLVSAYAETDDFGAYIAVQNTISSAVAPLVIKNINTNSQWAKYTIYLSASDFATSNFKVVLGLGFGSKEIRREYVEGFAYFDNVHYEVISKEDYEAGVIGAAEYNVYDETSYEAKEELVASEKGVAYNTNTAETDKYTERKFSLSHTRANKDINVNLAGGTAKTNTFGELVPPTGIAKVDSLANALAAINDDSVKAPTADTTTNALYFLHNEATSTTYTTSEFSLDEGKYLKLSFWVKASTKYPTDNALTITLNDLGLGSSTAAKTVIASNVQTTEYEDNENYNNWIEYVVYISNTLDADENVNETRVYTLTFDFGTTATSINDGTWGLTQGWAIITNPVGYEMTEADYDIANVSANVFAKKVSLSADRPNGIDNTEENDDSYNFTYGANDNNVIKNGVATNVSSYTGVVGGSTFVGGSNETTYSHTDVVAGLINSEYDYSSIDPALSSTALNALGKIGENEYVQPLMILTKGTTSFGYVGSNSTISTNSTVIISVKVKVLGNAEAYVYITNSNALDRFNVLGIDAEGKKVENGELVSDESGNVKKEFVIKVTADDMKDAYTEEGWLTIRFAITAGDEALGYRVELWNGERNGEAKAGIVLFDQYSASSAANTVDLVNELKLDYPDATVAETSYTRVPTLVKYTNEDGEEATKYISYKPTTVVSEYAECKTLIADLTTIHAVTEIDNTDDTTEEDTTTSEEVTSEEETSFSWALQITSIIIAVVLIALLLVVLGRMLYEKYKKKKGSSVSYYNRNSRERAGLAIEEKNARKAKEAATVEPEEEAKPYDYDNMENNIEEDSSNEEIVEETATEEVPADEASTEEVVNTEENGENN